MSGAGPRALLGALKRRAARAALSGPAVVECNACGWAGRGFRGDDWHAGILCPACGADVRHRLLIAGLTRVPGLEVERLVRGRRVLHVAPEPILARFLAHYAADVVTADLGRSDVDLNLDLSRMDAVDDAAFDVVIACDVLEHVPDDGAALDEIHRGLRAGGWAILTVPQKDGLVTTYEDASITTPEGRERAFGQHDHLRIYGDDFADVVAGHGFDVTVVEAAGFPGWRVERNVLAPPAPSPHPLATNRRQIVFAQRG